MNESHSGPTTSDPSPESIVSARDAEQQTRIAASPFELSQEPVTPEGPADPSRAGAGSAPAYEHLGELPSTYGTQSVYLVAYDPRQLFAYWDVDWATATDAVHALHVCRPDGQVEAEVGISSSEAGRYLSVEQPGGTYYVELGRHGRDGSWQPLAFSGRVTMPPPGLSGETEPKFATLPFHLSFQRLLELIQGAMGHGEDLTAALARLQRGGHPAVTASLLNTLGSLNGEQIHTLELLLGQKFGGSSSQEAGGSPGGAESSESPLRRDRQEVLSSGGAFGSETLSSGAFSSEHGTIHASGAAGSETLSSGFLAAGAGGSETLSSGAFSSEHGTIHALGAFGSESLSSGILAAGGGSEHGTIHALGAFGSESLSSGILAAGGGSEMLSSGAFGSESLSSGILAAGGGSEMLSSGAFSSETFSAFVAGLSSETLSSFGLSSEILAAGAGGSEALSSMSWQLAGLGVGPDSAGMDSERAEIFRRALGSNLDVLSSLFSAVNTGLSSGFSPGSSNLTSPGGW